jgi:hypothetical protein
MKRVRVYVRLLGVGGYGEKETALGVALGKPKYSLMK